MTTMDSPTPTRRRPASVDVAGTAWPLYKLEALVAAVLVLLALFAITADAQTAVLTAAATATVVWWARLLHYRSDTDRRDT